MLKAYAVFGGLVLAALSWAHYTGWGPSDVTEEKVKSVRSNPGSARPAYGGRTYTGAK
jgi:hypothetical protein